MPVETFHVEMNGVRAEFERDLLLAFTAEGALQRFANARGKIGIERGVAEEPFGPLVPWPLVLPTFAPTSLQRSATSWRFCWTESDSPLPTDLERRIIAPRSARLSRRLVAIRSGHLFRVIAAFRGRRDYSEEDPTRPNPDNRRRPSRLGEVTAMGFSTPPKFNKLCRFAHFGIPVAPHSCV